MISNNKKFLLILITFLFFNGYKGQLFSDDPDIYSDVPGFLTSRGFGFESYEITTNDSYHLTAFRIVNPCLPKGQLKPRPVLMWHGIGDSAEVFIRSRKGRLNTTNCVYSEDNNSVVNDCNSNITSTLGLTLSACGYDVWLANSRGNQYSNRGSELNLKYWEYSLTEIGLYDVPATVERVLNETGQETLSLIGYSMGTTISFILLSLRPDYERYIRPFIAIAPVAFLGLTRSLFRAISPIEPLVKLFAIPFGLPLEIAQLIGAYVCGNGVLVIFCLLYNELLYGKDSFNLDLSRVPSNFANALDIISSRVFLHYAQAINTGRFAQFDYGPILNLIKYDQLESPSYPLENIRLKHIYMFQGLNDKLADPLDGLKLKKKIPGVKEFRINPWPLWTHLDPSQAIHENKYQDVSILNILKSYN